MTRHGERGTGPVAARDTARYWPRIGLPRLGSRRSVRRDSAPTDQMAQASAAATWRTQEHATRPCAGP